MDVYPSSLNSPFYFHVLPLEISLQVSTPNSVSISSILHNNKLRPPFSPRFLKPNGLTAQITRFPL